MFDPDHRCMALLALCTAYFMVILDATIVNTALPAIGDELHVGVGTLQWIVNGYTLVFAALLLTGGTLADRHGARRVFLIGIALFTAASLACGLAPSAPALVGARLVQGLGAALAVPASLALMRAIYDDPGDRARAVGTWGAVAGIGAASGPIVGGLLTDTVGWRAVFVVNVPIGIAGAALAVRHIRVRGSTYDHPLDVAGQALSLVALTTLTFGLIEAGSSTWTNPLVLAMLAVAALAAAAFVVVERRSRAPMLPRSLFSGPRFSAGNVVGLLINLGLYGQLFVINLAFQQQRGWSPIQAGLAIVPEAALLSVASIASSRLTARRGPRPAMFAGLGIGALGLAGLAVLAAAAPYWALVVPLGLTGFGMAFVMPAATTAVVESAPSGRAGLASGVINTSRQIGSVIGVALLGSVAASVGLQASLAIAAAAFALGWVPLLILEPLGLHTRDRVDAHLADRGAA